MIITLSPGSGYGNNTMFYLNNNNLTRFEATVFQPVLEQIFPFAPYDTFVTTSSSTRFNSFLFFMKLLINFSVALTGY